MGSFLQLAKSKGSEYPPLAYSFLWKFMVKIFLPLSALPFFPPSAVAKLLTTVCATGGGAFKFEDEFHQVSDDDEGAFNEAECIIFNLSSPLRR
jgi:hypothetical protein